MNLGTAQIIRANALDLPLPDASVDLIVTSPPYFGLRSYQDGGQHYEGQIGDEATPAEFVDALIAATREMVRVLKPSGSIFVNLGDKYAGSGHGDTEFSAQGARNGNRRSRPSVVAGLRPKSLIGIPWRYALRCIDDLGLILRAEVIWSKPNGLPESVTDRVRRSHEQWFHLVKQPRYFSAVDEIREAHKSEPGREGKGALGGQKSLRPVGPGSGNYSPLGALPGSVRTVPTEPLRVPDHLGVDHFAAFPTAWPKWIIQGWAPTKGVCTACGEGRCVAGCACNARIATPLGHGHGDDPSRQTGRAGFDRPRLAGEGVRWITRWEQRHEAEQLRTSPHRDDMAAEAGSAFAHYIRTDASGARPIPEALRSSWRERGWLTEAPEFVPPATTPPVILDPFGGTGTTALVAKALGCHGISVDMSSDYCRLAEWRTNDPGQLAKVLGVEKPPEVDPAQADLFDLLGGDAA